jgi:tetratricopeptide (TPR) repeat protein
LKCHDSYPSLIVRTKIETIKNPETLLSEFDQLFAQNDRETIRWVISNGIPAYENFKSHKDLQSLDQAISKFEAITEKISTNNPLAPLVWSYLGLSLLARFEHLSKVEDINKAIQRFEIALGFTPDDTRYKPAILDGLGTSLMRRFEQLGNTEDIDAAITQQKAALHLTPDGHPHKPSRLSNLGNSFEARFERLQNLNDLDDAITTQQEAIDLTPDGHPYQPSHLSNLGNSLQMRFRWVHNIEDIDSSIIQQQAAVNLTPNGHPDKPMYLNNLGNSFSIRFERLGNLDDISSGIIQQQAAVDLTPDDHPDKPMYLNNLGTSLRIRFQQLGNEGDIDGAINRNQAAVDLISEGHFNKATYSFNLGKSYHLRFLSSHHPRDAKEALFQFSTSARASVGSPNIRFEAVRLWIDIASLIGHDSLLNAYECALDLIPLIAWLGLSIERRHHYLVDIGELVRDAAAAAISLEQYDKALEWLEQGRSIVWNQMLQLRTPVEELHAVDPDLAARLLHVSGLLDSQIEQEGVRWSSEENAQHYRTLTKEWESIIEKIRSLPDFQYFLKPRNISSLMDAAQNGPVVVLNITEKRCDALALVAGMEEVIHIPLPNITSNRVMEFRDELKNVLYSSGLRMRGDRAAQKWADEGEASDCKDILSGLWNGLVKPVLDYLAFSVRVI